MTDSQYIDIHTHQKKNDVVSVLNLFPEELSKINDTAYFSVGLHPREVSKVNIERQLELVENSAIHKNILAVGEIGLDKYKAEFELQKDVFIKQIKIAEKFKKPIIIHCVKAYSELQEILKKMDFKLPIIIHRYSGNITIAEELIKLGSYFSFGHELFNERSKTPKVFTKIPISRIFLETDDFNISVQEVYAKASELKDVNIMEIILGIKKNFQDCFQINL